MKFQLSTTVFTLLLLINNIEARWRPTQYMTWNIALGSDVDM